MGLFDGLTSLFGGGYAQKGSGGGGSWGGPAPKKVADPGPSALDIQNASVGTSGTYSGGTAPAYDANTDPNQVAAHRAQVQSLLSGLNDAYNNLFGAVDQNVAAKRGQIDQNYQQQFDTQDKNLQNTQDQTQNIYAARGASNSSYNAKSQGQNLDAYNTDRGNLIQGRDQNYADLGKFAATTKANLNAGRPNVDLSQYQDVNALNALRDQLDAHIKNIQTQQVGLGTDQGFIGGLNQIAPAQSNLQSQLADKLAALSKSSAPESAKNAIAQGYIKLAGADPNYWQNYYMTLSAPQAGPQVPATVA